MYFSNYLISEVRVVAWKDFHQLLHFLVCYRFDEVVTIMREEEKLTTEVEWNQLEDSVSK